MQNKIWFLYKHEEMFFIENIYKVLQWSFT